MAGSSILGCRLPVVVAPMAGGPTTVELCRAVARAGAFPFLAGGYKTVEALDAEIRQLRDLDSGFGVNLFVPGTGAVDGDEFRSYADELQPEADTYGLELDPVPVEDDDHFPEKVRLLVEHPVPVVSLTFGLPEAGVVEALVGAGSLVLADEAGTSATHRAAIVDPGFTRTVLTRAFTGRPARGLENGFIERHEHSAPVDAYPAVHHLTRPLRRAASESGDSQRLHLWAGTGYRSAPEWSAERIVRWLSRDLEI